MTVQDLPVVNASLNALASALLVAAFVCIKYRNIRAHAWLMIGAFTTSAVFLVFYLIYHFNVGHRSSDLQPGLFRTGYLTMLFSHIVLAIVMLPMIFMALWRAYRRQWSKHATIASPTFWIWFYVSVTGVLIYAILYHVVPAMYPADPTAMVNP
jgi:uncharacterized membrane protein YozB (DUF420 family)